MPVMDGYEASRQIKESIRIGVFPDMKIVAATAYAFNEKIEMIFEAGMDGYLPKPLHLSEVRDVLKRHLS